MTPRTTATTKTRTRKARAVAKDIVPRSGPFGMGIPALALVERAQAAAEPSYVDRDGFDDALAAARSAVDDALAEHKKRAGEYDARERALRGQRPIRHARLAVRQSIPVAVATASGAFYRLNSRGQLEATPLDEKAEKHMAEILRLHAEQDGTPDVPGPGKSATPPEAPRTEDPPTGAPGPGTPPDDPALDEARDE